jgi:hypothetical protein
VIGIEVHKLRNKIGVKASKQQVGASFVEE